MSFIEELKQVEGKIIAVDFDGTLCEDIFPKVGLPKMRVIEVVKALSLKNRIVLWTCREGDLLIRAIQWCEQFDLRFNHINENVPENKLLYMGKAKIIADYYIDDKSINPALIK